jgi:DNA-binding NarL/FixJ family response regulator
VKHHILIADDHSIIRDGLKMILGDTPDLEVAGEASDGVSVMEKVRERDWALAVLDISMPGRNGLELIRLIKAERPRLPILIFSMHPEEQYAVRAIRAGASGYLSKEGDTDQLVPAIRKILSGGLFISAKVAELLAADLSPNSGKLPHQVLSDREFEIFGRLVSGESLTDIAESLSISIKTISTHKSRILQKMGMSNQTELVRYALEHHLFDASQG